MAPSILESYRALSSASPRSQVTATLQSIVNAPLTAFDIDQRTQLVQLLLTDVKDAKGRLSQKDISLALLAVKTLGRHPQGSQVIASSANLELLRGLISAPGQNAEVINEALRCIANSLLLVESGREAWISIGGGEIALEILERPSSSPEFLFLASRILFLLTLKQSPFLQKLVEEYKIVEVMSYRYDTLMTSLLGSQPMAKEALIDLLKFTFNLLLQYPRMVDAQQDKGKGKETDSPAQRKVMGELWDDKFEGLLSPLLRVFNTLPTTAPSPLAPPLTHVIHALLNIPVAPFASKWFSPDPRFTPPTKPAHVDAFHKALALLSKSPRRRTSSSGPSTPTRTGSPPSASIDTLRRVYDLLEVTTSHYVPGDPDDPAVRQQCKSEGVDLDELATPLVVLLTRLVAGDESAKLRVRDWLLPVDLDRTHPLEKREDLLGRCIRLLTSVYFSRLKDGVGELLFAVCDSDASTMAAQIGYGNAAGFLFNKGILAPPPGSSGPPSNLTDGSINPITGTTPARKPDNEPEMTDEEKEREAERLFVLFDRLERTGVGVVNPIRKAMQEGKFQ